MIQINNDNNINNDNISHGVASAATSVNLRRVRSRWAAIGAAVAVTLGAGGLGLVDAAESPGSATFVPMSPCRLIDTRANPDRVGPHHTLGPGDRRTVTAHGENGACIIPSSATALSLNTTALGATEPTFITVWPEGIIPRASSLNPSPGQPPTPNAVVVPLSGDGTFEVFNLTGSVDLIVDVNGFYVAAGVEQLARRLDALEAEMSVANQADAAARLTTLEARQTFARSDEPPSQWVGVDASTVAAVAITAPVAGTMTLNSSVVVHDAVAGNGLSCSISASADVESEHAHLQQSAGYPSNYASLSGTRLFEIGAGETVTYRLNCKSLTGVLVSAANPKLTAIFNPGDHDSPYAFTTSETDTRSEIRPDGDLRHGLVRQEPSFRPLGRGRYSPSR